MELQKSAKYGTILTSVWQDFCVCVSQTLTEMVGESAYHLMFQSIVMITMKL